MTIIDALKITGEGVRITNGDRWMVWDKEAWIVCERQYRQRKTRILIETQSEEEAVNIFIED